jgi:nicotinamidase/pyrazinamidase
MKKALIIVDPQNDFINGSLSVPNAIDIIPIINGIDKSQFDVVILTQDNHPANHKSFASNHEGKKVFENIKVNDIIQTLWPDHCVQNDEGSFFHKDLDLNIPNLYIFRKGENPEMDSYSAFYENDHKTSTGLTDFLRERGIDGCFICGLATDYCVKYTAIDSAHDGFSTFVIMDATRGISEDLSGVLFDMINCGITLVDSTEL